LETFESPWSPETSGWMRPNNVTVESGSDEIPLLVRSTTPSTTGRLVGSPSKMLLDEVRSVLTERPRLRKWISLEAATLYVGTLATVSDVQPNPASGPELTRDPDNDYVIYLARAYEVGFVVSGDADLLEWDEQNPPVIPPAEFEVRLSQS